MRLRSCGLGLALLLTLVLTLAGQALAQEKEKITLRLEWIPGSEHGYIYLGRDKGFFAEEGIDLDIVPGQGSTLSVKLVGNGDSDFGLADGTTVVRAWETGVPLIVLHVVYQDTPTVIFGKKQAGIEKLTDICGHKVGVTFASTTYAQYKAMLRAAHIDCDVPEVPMPVGGGFATLTSGAADLIATYTINEPVMARVRGIEGIEFFARDYVSLYSQTIITSKNVVEKRGDLAQRFQRAILKSLKYGLDHPDEVLAAFFAGHKDADVDYERAKLVVVDQLQTIPGHDGRKIGTQTMAGWNQTIDTLLKLGAIKTQVDPTGRFIQAPGS